MRIRDRETYHDEPVNLMSLIDTLFFLIMFFLVATQFKEEERALGVQLPGLASSQPLSAMPRQLIINVCQDGSTVVSGKPVDERELGQLLAGIALNDSGREVLIRADQRSIHQYFAGVAALCRRAGISEVKIGYIVEEPK